MPMIVKERRSFTSLPGDQAAAAIEAGRRIQALELPALHLQVEVAHRRLLRTDLVRAVHPVVVPPTRGFKGSEHLRARDVRTDLRRELLEQAVRRPCID